MVPQLAGTCDVSKKRDGGGAGQTSDWIAAAKGKEADKWNFPFWVKFHVKGGQWGRGGGCGGKNAAQTCVFMPPNHKYK